MNSAQTLAVAGPWFTEVSAHEIISSPRLEARMERVIQGP